MRWDVTPAPEESIRLAQALVERSTALGWRRRTLEEAAQAACGDVTAWRRHFPRGARDAIWFISEVSDASMSAAFEQHKALDLTAVITERLEQNIALKPFVRRVMVFDATHPFQALARMQRTARLMLKCLPQNAKKPSVWALNIAYTAIVFVWLVDRSQKDAATGRVTRRLMALIGSS